jgi:hypothetical protein
VLSRDIVGYLLVQIMKADRELGHGLGWFLTD